MKHFYYITKCNVFWENINENSQFKQQNYFSQKKHNKMAYYVTKHLLFSNFHLVKYTITAGTANEETQQIPSKIHSYPSMMYTFI